MKWIVTVPIKGTATIVVDAETKAEAISAGVEQITIDNLEDWDVVGSQADAECDEDEE